MGNKEYPDTTRTFESSGEPARMIGPYHLLQKIGEGGMGEVWVAEQHKPIHRRVALKLIKAGMDTKQVIARFESERQALAMMDHPAIAKVFEAGETDKGHPYFVMEYVQGIPITSHCDQNRLTTEERLELFIRICEGVQHAHQKAVIHRDLKPSNILVAIQDGKAVPKIIDFGVAKATAQSLTERTMYTELGVLIGTPEYMSPEQAEMSGQNIDTRTDVYSLGAILYELLVGALPFDPKELRQAGFDEIRRKIREEDPPKPSTKLSTMGEASTTQAQNRRTERPALIRQIRGDLDWITMKTLEKDRTRRYGSPWELAADIDRYLSHQPIVARPPSTVYKTKKFVRRHRVGVGVATTLALILVGFSVMTAIQARRIARERDRANQEAEASRQVSDFLTGLFKVSDPSEARGNSVTAREVLDKGAREIDRALSQQPELQARLQATMGAVYISLGLYAEALPLLQQAMATQRHLLGPGHPETLKVVNSLANLYWYQDRLREAEPLYLDLVTQRRRTLGKEHPDTLRAEYDLASLYMAEGRWDEAERLSRSTLDVQRRTLGEEHPDTLASMNNLGGMYFETGRYADAESLHTRVFEARLRVLGPDHPDSLESEHNLATTYVELGDYDRAEPLLNKTLSASLRVNGEKHPYTLGTQRWLALMYARQGRYLEAEPLAQAVHEGLLRALGPDHKLTQRVIKDLINLYDAWGKSEKADIWRAKLLSLEKK